MEMLRMASALWAFSLLRGSRGGRLHLVDLERRRLGLARTRWPAMPLPGRAFCLAVPLPAGCTLAVLSCADIHLVES